MFETYVWELPVKEFGYCKVAGYTNSFLKNQLVHWNFWSIYFRVKLSKDLFLHIFMLWGHERLFHEIATIFSNCCNFMKKIWVSPSIFLLLRNIFFFKKFVSALKKKFKSIWNKQIFWEKREFVSKLKTLVTTLATWTFAT